jgi:hypothetical protein
MKYIYIIAIAAFTFWACERLDYKDKEFFKNEINIISNTSKSGFEREMYNEYEHFFVDTTKVLNKDFTLLDTIESANSANVNFKFKIGIGGSKTINKDIKVYFSLDTAQINYMGKIQKRNFYIPKDFVTNATLIEGNKYSITIPKGQNSQKLEFTIKVTKTEYTKYRDAGFAISLDSADEVKISNTFNKISSIGVNVNVNSVNDYNGFPIPPIPEGRYYSPLAETNATHENKTSTGRHNKWKFITKLSTKPEDKWKFIIWGHSSWTFDGHGNQTWQNSYMYNGFVANDTLNSKYTLQVPKAVGQYGLPKPTFHWETWPEETVNNVYDPINKTITIYYNNVIKKDYVDILTFVDKDMKLYSGTDRGVPSWEFVKSQLSSSPYKVRLPTDDDWE